MWYILEDMRPRPAVDMLEPTERSGKGGIGTVIHRTRVGETVISTVFLSFDHGSIASGDIAILFETMVFGGEYDSDMRRYATIGEAKLGHFEMVEMVKSSYPFDPVHLGC